MKPDLRLRRALCACLFLLCASFHARSQGWDTLPWRSFADYKLQPLNKSYAATGVLYDRVFPIANLDEFTGSLNYTDTSSPRHFAQAYYELYNSAYNTSGWLSPEGLDSAVNRESLHNSHPLGLFLYNFNSLDTNAFQDNLVDTNSNGQFTDVAGRSRNPYFTHTAFMGSVLLGEDEVLDSGTHTFFFDPQFFLQNASFTINTISLDFGDGQGWQTRTVNNPGARGGLFSWVAELLGSTRTIRILISGVSILGQSISYGGVFNITVKIPHPYAELTDCKGNTKWVIDADPTALAAVNAQYGNPQLDYSRTIEGPCSNPIFGTACKITVPVKDTAYFYFAGGGSCGTNRVVRRPIIFIDGFLRRCWCFSLGLLIRSSPHQQLVLS